ncbi:MAG TPA: PQQ-binding-like beta-propeller repeat protein [Gammaproteobacteria bacterium]|nr:PQQ-binding-like beta-propeller repeat protein [Gammaproteobacteria bacterium]
MIEKLRSASSAAMALGVSRAVLAVSAAALGISGGARGDEPGGAGATLEWPVYGGNLAAQHYAPLDQIDASNVAKLQVVWSWYGANYGPRPETRSEATPLMIGGVLYTTAGVTRNVVAIDAATGETLWVWRPNEGERFEQAPRKSSGRGVAYWSDGRGDERVMTVTPGFQLVALDAQTGLPVRGFGEGGVVDLKQGLRGTGDMDIGSSSPPLVVGDVVVVGPAHLVSARPKSKSHVKGDVRGFDARTGKLLWTFHTIPEKGEFGYDTWLAGSAEYTGNAGVWAPMAADPDLGLVYLPVEAPTGDMYAGSRPGNDLFGNSLVAVDAKTGERRWHQQLIHHDHWDWDNPTSPILLDVNVGGRPVKAVVQLTKQAFAYAFDRATGEPLWPMEERPVPASDVPGEWSSPTQPFPTRPPAYDRQGFGVDDLVDFTPEIRAAALESIKGLRMGPLYTPPSRNDDPDGTKGTLVLPSYGGGSNWEGGAVDPETGILYVGSTTNPVVEALERNPDASSEVQYLFAPGQVPSPMGLPLVKPPYGRITAIDMNRGENVWMVPNGDTPKSIKENPALKGVEVPPTGKPVRAELLVTKTLLFAGEGWGGDPILRAYDKATGKVVAEIRLPGQAGSVPMTYMLDGRQYIVLSVGRPEPAELVALALPK